MPTDRYREDAVEAQKNAAAYWSTATAWTDLGMSEQARAWQTRAAMEYKSARVLRLIATDPRAK